MVPSRSRRLHYAWIVVAATFVLLLVGAGVRSVPGVLILPLENEFGWNRAIVSLAVSINLLLFGLCGPFASAVMDRIGMRRMMIGALLILAVGVASTTLMQTVWQLYLLWGVIVGMGTGAITGWVAATVANRWFVERRGVVVGLLTASSATGQLIFLPVLADLAVNNGWRTAVLLVTGVIVAIIPIVALFVRDYPQDIGVRPYGAPADAPAEAPRRAATGNPFAVALRSLAHGARSRDFLLLSGSFFICGASTNGLIGTHLIPASVEHGIPEVAAAGLLALIGVFDIIGTLGSGYLSDRYDNRWLLCWYYSLRGLSLLFLPYTFGSGYFALGLFVVFYGLDWVATVPPTVRLAADQFGKQHVGTYYSWIFAAHQLGAATAAFGAGALRTWLGDYQASFMAAGVLCLLAAGLVIRIGRTPRDQRIVVQTPA